MLCMLRSSREITEGWWRIIDDRSSELEHVVVLSGLQIIRPAGKDIFSKNWHLFTLPATFISCFTSKTIKKKLFQNKNARKLISYVYRTPVRSSRLGLHKKKPFEVWLLDVTRKLAGTLDSYQE